MKRSTNSIFTIDELKEYCDKNEFYYINDSDIITLEDGCRCVQHDGNKYLIHTRYPFLYKNDVTSLYECLLYSVITNKVRHDRFYLHDIIETTLEWQRPNFFSKFRCAAFDCKNKQNVILSDLKIYCVKNKCWYRCVSPDNKYVDEIIKT
jgi:hypothetical protein